MKASEIHTSGQTSKRSSVIPSVRPEVNVLWKISLGLKRRTVTLSEMLPQKPACKNLPKCHLHSVGVYQSSAVPFPSGFMLTEPVAAQGCGSRAGPAVPVPRCPGPCQVWTYPGRAGNPSFQSSPCFSGNVSRKLLRGAENWVGEVGRHKGSGERQVLQGGEREWGLEGETGSAWREGYSKAQEQESGSQLREDLKTDWEWEKNGNGSEEHMETVTSTGSKCLKRTENVPHPLAVLDYVQESQIISFLI